jgi:AcrR family transcriptional regulator
MSDQNGSASEDPGKRHAILEHAIRTFAQLGFRRTDVQAIADLAGVGKGTVYRYFHSKEDLFWAATYEINLRLERAVFAAMEGVDGACPKLRAAAAAYSRFFEDNPHYLELTVQDRAEFHGAGPESHLEHHEKMIRMVGQIMRQGIEDGELRPVPDVRQTMLAMGSLLYGAAVLGCHLKSVAVAEMTEHGVDVFLRGLRTTSDETPVGSDETPVGSKERISQCK